MPMREIPTNIDFEIINIVPMNDYISSCEIKVFYHGKNRNGSYISKAVGNVIANSLPRTPIVAFYNEEINDYEDHGQEIIINRNGIKFISKTVPYGAVSETSPIVWKQFLNSNGETKEYLVCKGYLWTGRYPHLNMVLENSKSQSMEFFPESISGDWAKFDNEEQEFFIFNEASISALCILGNDVEPCFEGASIGKPEILYSLKKDEFTQEFNNFMLELNKVLEKSTEGGEATLDKDNKDFEKEDLTDKFEKEEFEKEEFEKEEFEKEEEKEDEFEKKEEEEEDKFEKEEDKDEFEKEEEKEDEFEKKEEEVKDDFTQLQSNHVELKQQFEILQDSFNELESKYNLLVQANNEKTREDKEAICAKFVILGDEILNEIKAKLDNFTVDELEEKLSAIAFKKGISFSAIDENSNIITPNPQQKRTNDVPAWLKAVENRANNK